MKKSELMTFVIDNAKTQGFYGFAFEKIDRDNLWDDLAALMALNGVNDDEDMAEYFEVFEYFRHCDVLTHELPALTRFAWRVNGQSFSVYAKQFDRVSERLYWHFLEILPPYYKPRGFMVSEPYGYCEIAKQSTYAAFCNKDGKHYFLGNIAPKRYDEIFEQLKTL